MNNIKSAELSPARKFLINYLNKCKREFRDPNYLELSEAFSQKFDSNPEAAAILKEFAQSRLFQLLENQDEIVERWINEHQKDWYTSQGGESLEPELEKKIATDLAHYFPENNEMETLANKYPRLFGLYAAEECRRNYYQNYFKMENKSHFEKNN